MHPEPWGNDPIWRSYFSDGLKLETTQLVIKISIDQSVKWNVMTQMLHRTGVWKLYLHGRWKRASLKQQGKSGVNNPIPWSIWVRVFEGCSFVLMMLLRRHSMSRSCIDNPYYRGMVLIYLHEWRIFHGKCKYITHGSQLHHAACLYE